MSQWPIGTPDEIKALGLNPDEAATCSAPKRVVVGDDKTVKQSGCAFWRFKNPINESQEMECTFMKDRETPTGGKIPRICGHGPKYVAYWHRLDKAEVRPGEFRPRSGVHFAPCFQWEASMRMRFDNQAVNGERILLVGVEGDGQKFPQQVVKIEPHPTDAKEKVKKIVTEMQEIPKFPRPDVAYPDLEFERLSGEFIVEQGDKANDEAMAAYLSEMKQVAATEARKKP